MIGAGIGGPVADYLNNYQPGLGYFAIFAGYGLLFLLSTLTLRWVKFSPSEASYETESLSGAPAFDSAPLPKL
jgi:hypothetical protein